MLNRFARYFGIAGVVVLAGAALFTNAQDGGTSTALRVQERTYAFKDAGKDVGYALYVPSTYDKTKKTPLVIALHGLGSNPKQIMLYPGMTGQAEKYGFIVAAPMGYNSRGWYGQAIPKKLANKADPEKCPR
jgi:poly(3-hydroxybutyrate) depolymerase